MHSLMEILVKSAVFGRFCFVHTYRGRSETYRQRNINSKHTVQSWAKVSVPPGISGQLPPETIDGAS